MNQNELYKKIRKQEEHIREMEQAASLLEEQNSLQKQLIEALMEENRLLQKHADDYSDAMRRMLDDFYG